MLSMMQQISLTLIEDTSIQCYLLLYFVSMITSISCLGTFSGIAQYIFILLLLTDYACPMKSLCSFQKSVDILLICVVFR